MSFSIYPDKWDESLMQRIYFHEEYPNLDNVEPGYGYKQDAEGWYRLEHLAPVNPFLKRWIPVLENILGYKMDEEYVLNIPQDRIDSLKELMNQCPDSISNIEEVYLWCKTHKASAYII